jgi:hypothetical protein
MAVGSGISASFGIATETTVGTPVAVTRFFEFDNESLQVKKHTVQGMGLRQGGLLTRASRRAVVSREVQGDVNLDVPSNGFGLLLVHMLGSTTTTATSVGGGLYRQIHNIGSLNGKSFTTQIVRPDTSGDLTQAAFTYPGCKITDWEFSVQQAQQVKLKLSIDALDEATPSNSFASTTLSAGSAVNAATLTTVGAVPAGAYISLDTGALTAEVVRVGTVTGSGPYTLTLAAGSLPTQVHATGAVVSSATGLNYGAVTALQTASYTATATMFNFSQGVLIAGGTTGQAAGLWSNTGGTVVGNVRSFTLTGKNSVRADRWGLGTQIRSEQIENGFREYTCEAEIDYNSRAFYDAYAADMPLDMQLTFTTPAGAILQFIIPANYQDDGGNPQVGGPDIITVKPKWTILDDGTNGALQAVYTSTDAAV